MFITKFLVLLTCLLASTTAWYLPIHPVARGPPRYTRFAPPPHRIIRPIHIPDDIESERAPEAPRPKRDHDFDDHDHDHERRHGSSGVTGPVHTFVKTDKNANYKWGVRHHVGNKYAS